MLDIALTISFIDEANNEFNSKYNASEMPPHNNDNIKRTPSATVINTRIVKMLRFMVAEPKLLIFMLPVCLKLNKYMSKTKNIKADTIRIIKLMVGTIT